MWVRGFNGKREEGGGSGGGLSICRKPACFYHASDKRNPGRSELTVSFGERVKSAPLKTDFCQ